MTWQATAPAWEQRLIALAQEALRASMDVILHWERIEKDSDLQDAIAACEAITAEYSRSFYLATQLLPEEKRRAMRVLYAFCRIADNLADDRLADDRRSSDRAADDQVDQPEAKLLRLRENITGKGEAAGDPVLKAWSNIQKRYAIPLRYAEQLLDGVESDLAHRHYRNFEELSVYCYRVASTVGLMSMHISGYSDGSAIPYAIKLGVALQLTNILRDVGEDWQAGRLYLPLDELKAFGLEESDVDAARVDGRWREFMRLQIARARRLYAEAMPGIALLHPDGHFAVAAAAFLYQGILEDIERHDYDVFNRRAFASRGLKLAALVRAFIFIKRLEIRPALDRLASLLCLKCIVQIQD